MASMARWLAIMEPRQLLTKGSPEGRGPGACPEPKPSNEAKGKPKGWELGDAPQI